MRNEFDRTAAGISFSLKKNSHESEHDHGDVIYVKVCYDNVCVRGWMEREKYDNVANRSFEDATVSTRWNTSDLQRPDAGERLRVCILVNTVELEVHFLPHALRKTAIFYASLGESGAPQARE